MHVNVWEWCEDYWHETYEGAPHDDSAWLSGGYSTRWVVRRAGGTIIVYTIAPPTAIGTIETTVSIISVCGL